MFCFSSVAFGWSGGKQANSAFERLFKIHHVLDCQQPALPFVGKCQGRQEMLGNAFVEKVTVGLSMVVLFSSFSGYSWCPHTLSCWLVKSWYLLFPGFTACFVEVSCFIQVMYCLLWLMFMWIFCFLTFLYSCSVVSTYVWVLTSVLWCGPCCYRLGGTGGGW